MKTKNSLHIKDACQIKRYSSLLVILGVIGLPHMASMILQSVNHPGSVSMAVLVLHCCIPMLLFTAGAFGLKYAAGSQLGSVCKKISAALMGVCAASALMNLVEANASAHFTDALIASVDLIFACLFFCAAIKIDWRETITLTH